PSGVPPFPCVPQCPLGDIGFADVVDPVGESADDAEEDIIMFIVVEEDDKPVEMLEIGRELDVIGLDIIELDVVELDTMELDIIMEPDIIMPLDVVEPDIIEPDIIMELDTMEPDIVELATNDPGTLDPAPAEYLMADTKFADPGPPVTAPFAALR
ncbi:hypothetical protein LTR28_004185, partial [Elasticomyces elasticus]